MKLWHQMLVKYLDDKLLLEQHDVCCKLRAEQWDSENANDYVHEHPFSWLFCYHDIVLKELVRRGHKVDMAWRVHTYRGKLLMYSASSSKLVEEDYLSKSYAVSIGENAYPEHDNAYLGKCLDELQQMNVELNGTTIEELRLKLALVEGI